VGHHRLKSRQTSGPPDNMSHGRRRACVATRPSRGRHHGPRMRRLRHSSETVRRARADRGRSRRAQARHTSRCPPRRRENETVRLDETLSDEAVTQGRCRPRRLAASSTDLLAFHRPRLTSPRLLPAARPRLPVESSLRPARSEINATRFGVLVPSFPDHDDHRRERSETSSSASGSRSRRRRLSVCQPQCASSAKGPRAQLVRVVHDAFPRLDET
jgi:hypothetical protein